MKGPHFCISDFFGAERMTAMLLKEPATLLGTGHSKMEDWYGENRRPGVGRNRSYKFSGRFNHKQYF